MTKLPSEEKLRELGFKPYMKTEPAWMKQMDKAFEVDTKEGKMKGKAGDMLCIGVEGEMWPLRPGNIQKDIQAKMKYNIQDLRDIVETEGLEYAVRHYLSPADIIDPRIQKMWKDAKDALETLAAEVE